MKFYLVRKVIRDLERAGEAPLWADVMQKVFPMYKKIETDFVHAHVSFLSEPLTAPSPEAKIRIPFSFLLAISL